jgi:hypothetical protein
MSNKIAVGTVLYGVNKGKTYAATVTKSGTKYFYVNDREEGYSHETLEFKNKTYTNHRIQLYRTEQEILDEREYWESLQFIRRYFDNYSKVPLTLEQLRTIKKIIDNEQ